MFKTTSAFRSPIFSPATLSLRAALPGLFNRAVPRMMGACFIGGLLMFAAPVNGQEAGSSDRWVSDSLTTYVRSGPTDGYRIVGTLTSGEQVELVTTQGDYSRVRSASGDTVWIPTSQLQEVPGQGERLPQLEQQVAELSAELEAINGTWDTRVEGMRETLDSRKALIEELEATRQALNTELTETQSELRSVQAQLGDESKQVLMRYMLYGGGIAGAGIIFGLILPSMTRSRKRNDGWV
jgi:SH3 domain protein